MMIGEDSVTKTSRNHDVGDILRYQRVQSLRTKTGEISIHADGS